MAQFVDRATLHLQAGDGGHGCTSVHREKFKPLGGPDGGNGGHGGDIILEVSTQVHTLLDFQYRPHIKAQRGANGAGDWRNGARGEDLVLEVPVGTVVRSEDGDVLADLTVPGTRFIAAEGGFGGLGNAALATAKRKAPGFSLKGEPGEAHDLILELKSMADVGLVGFPSAGKSSLISVVSAAKPKIADYPFTTLAPNLGVVNVGHDTFTIADVPGLIPGASEGRGLGLDFLRHIERTAVLAHIVDVATMEPGRDPISDIEALEHELDTYADALDMDSGLGDLRERPRLVVLNKMDIPEAKELADFLRADIEEKFGWPVYMISTATREGLDELKWAMWDIVKRTRKKRRTMPIAEPQVIRPKTLSRRGEDGGVEVVRDPMYPEGWLVTGEKVERWVRQTDFENDEAVGYLSDRLNKAGVEDMLRKAGAHEGDTVTIGEISFDWEPTIGGDPTLAGRGQDARLGGTDRTSAAERKRASQARRGLIDEYDYGTGEEADRERWQG
ncbi:GTPase ObgE [Corynebacterium sp. HMSC05H05]|uniref:GTPase ObgE n=1 Tax=Corynebacterium sp. HMSC05H05 TaxID=1581119 RepID=UPI0008A1FF5B|nr:GTPase ObgE [Corynebacterium sp. HMSC05H05]OFT58631.1 GTPase ObgE [Corynebacterium sp. HMSC05H05]